MAHNKRRAPSVDLPPTQTQQDDRGEERLPKRLLRTRESRNYKLSRDGEEDSESSQDSYEDFGSSNDDLENFEDALEDSEDLASDITEDVMVVCGVQTEEDRNNGTEADYGSILRVLIDVPLGKANQLATRNFHRKLLRDIDDYP